MDVYAHPFPSIATSAQYAALKVFDHAAYQTLFHAIVAHHYGGAHVPFHFLRTKPDLPVAAAAAADHTGSTLVG